MTDQGYAANCRSNATGTVADTTYAPGDIVHVHYSADWTVTAEYVELTPGVNPPHVPVSDWWHTVVTNTGKVLRHVYGYQLHKVINTGGQDVDNVSPDRGIDQTDPSE